MVVWNNIIQQCSVTFTNSPSRCRLLLYAPNMLHANGGDEYTSRLTPPRQLELKFQTIHFFRVGSERRQIWVWYLAIAPYLPCCNRACSRRQAPITSGKTRVSRCLNTIYWNRFITFNKAFMKCWTVPTHGGPSRRMRHRNACFDNGGWHVTLNSVALLAAGDSLFN